MPADPVQREDIMRPVSQQGTNGITATRGVQAGDRMPQAAYQPENPPAARPLGLATQVGAAAVALAGLWLAISPWFLTLQTLSSGNARATDLIIGLAVAACGMLALVRFRATPGLAGTSLAGGIWLIIAPFILAAKFSTTGSMYWSNSWAGGVVIVASLAMLAASVRAVRAR